MYNERSRLAALGALNLRGISIGVVMAKFTVA